MSDVVLESSSSSFLADPFSTFSSSSPFFLPSCNLLSSFSLSFFALSSSYVSVSTPSPISTPELLSSGCSTCSFVSSKIVERINGENGCGNELCKYDCNNNIFSNNTIGKIQNISNINNTVNLKEIEKQSNETNENIASCSSYPSSSSQVFFFFSLFLISIIKCIFYMIALPFLFIFLILKIAISYVPEPQRLDKADTTVYVSERHSYVLLKSACLISIPTFIGFYLSVYDLAVVSLIVFCTSLNHWRKPRLGIRRFMDIMAVSSAFVYHFIAAIYRVSIIHSLIWFSLTVLAMVFYFHGRKRCSVGMHKSGTFCHIMLHVISCISSSFLYHAVYLQKS